MYACLPNWSNIYLTFRSLKYSIRARGSTPDDPSETAPSSICSPRARENCRSACSILSEALLPDKHTKILSPSFNMSNSSIAYKNRSWKNHVVVGLSFGACP